MMITIKQALSPEVRDRKETQDKYYESLHEAFLQGVLDTVQYFDWASKQMRTDYMFTDLVRETAHVATRPSNPQTDLDREYDKGRLKGLEVVFDSFEYKNLRTDKKGKEK